MIGHYLLSAVRNLRRRPLFAAIKLLALALGFACYLTANLIAEHVGRTDRQWPNDGRIFAVSQAVTAPGADVESGTTIGAISGPAVEYLKVDFQDVVIAATQTLQPPVRVGGVQHSYNVLAVDPEFLRIFDLDPSGGHAGALAAPTSVLVEAAAARELFGGAEPTGQVMQIGRADFTVAGVFEWPSPSHLGAGGTGKNIRALVSRAALSTVYGVNFAFPPVWSTTCCTTYLLRPEGGPTAAELEARLDRFSTERVPPEFGKVRFALMPIGDIGQAYLNLGLFGGAMDLSLVTILNLFAALILAVACVDFANLAAAEAATRSREIGVRKTVGASRRQVVAQTMVDVGVLTLAALAIVLPLTLLIVTPVGRAIRLDIAVTEAFARADHWLGMLGVAAAVCVAAGAYPAFVLARLRPIASLRASGARGGAGAVRTALTVAQFAAASFLLAAAAVMVLQKAALRDRLADPSQDPRLTITIDPSAIEFDPRTLRTELGLHRAVTGLTGSASPPFRRAVVTGIPPATIARSEDPSAAQIPIQQRFVHQDYFDVAGIRLLAGRDFDELQDMPEPPPAAPDDDDEPEGNLRAPMRRIVIDERLAGRLGLTPQEAIGTVLYQSAQSAVADRSGGPPRLVNVTMPAEIVGVAAATPLEYMTEGPDSYVYVFQPFAASTLIVRIARDDVAGATAHIDATWPKFFPGQPIQRAFLDEAFDANFQMFNVLGMTFVGLALIAVAIAAMGLFGIASFVVQRRAREIGVRKTLGATRKSVLALMVWDFSKLVIAANLVAWPLAFIAARAYLNLFVQRIELSPAPFVFALGVSLLIAWIAVGTHALRAARVQPALVLRAD